MGMGTGNGLGDYTGNGFGDWEWAWRLGKGLGNEACMDVKVCHVRVIVSHEHQMISGWLAYSVWCRFILFPNARQLAHPSGCLSTIFVVFPELASMQKYFFFPKWLWNVSLLRIRS